YAIDENSVLSHGSSVYVPVFDSKTTPQWPGNLRKFTLSNGQIVDASGNPALDANSRFLPQAKDMWSSQAHGSDVTIGGAASKLPSPDVRKLWTDVGAALVAISADNDAITTAMLTSDTRRTKSRLVELNGDAGPTGMSCLGNYTDCDGTKVKVFGDPDTLAGCVNIAEVTTCPGEPVSDTYRTTLLNFVRGYKDGVAGTGGVARNHMGDMLNSKPVVVDYGSSTVVFSATNEGFLHAIDADTGAEKWAFMPSPLLKNQDAFFRNEDSRHHIYGIDGPLSVWRQDENNNGQIDGDDKVYLYFGLRRGGRMYYALDITDPDSKPLLKWRVDPSISAFATLGETWSRPTLARIRLKSTTGNSGELKYVMVFGGGYDPVKDALIGNNGLGLGIGSNRPADTLGHDVYMVDAETGTLVWSIKHAGSNGGVLSGASQLKDSIPGDIRILDMDNNGSLDRLYFADTGGNVWRVDMEIEQGENGTYDYSKARLTKLAALGGGDMNPDNRMFFYEPDVALRLEKGEPLLTVALGSGYRTHPLSADTEDRFYVLRDKYVYTAAPADDSYYPITDSALVERDQMLEDEKNFLEYEDKKGWYYPFTARYAEKVLAPALTFLDKVIFTTFSRTDENGNQSLVDACQPATNISRAYVLDIMTGAPVANLDRDDNESKDDFVNAGSNELLDMPQVIFGAPKAEDGGECTAGDCYQTVTVRVGKNDLPLLDSNNTTPDGSGGYGEMVDLTRLLPRIFWKNDNTAEEATTTTTPVGN
ncbi:MAG: PQQ-binding-like beta-propeller repeat protein, partial [Thiothrix sp.]|nr:PQQ-binding-like beta-propeller repeat protein [Thiothrix sp.]